MSRVFGKISLLWPTSKSKIYRSNPLRLSKFWFLDEACDSELGQKDTFWGSQWLWKIMRNILLRPNSKQLKRQKNRNKRLSVATIRSNVQTTPTFWHAGLAQKVLCQLETLVFVSFYLCCFRYPRSQGQKTTKNKKQKTTKQKQERTNQTKKTKKPNQNPQISHDVLQFLQEESPHLCREGCSIGCQVAAHLPRRKHQAGRVERKSRSGKSKNHPVNPINN